jgi:hypothetical protein
MQNTKISYSEYIYFNKGLQTYGNGVKINAFILKVAIAIYASLPLFSAWAFVLIPKVKSFWVRW